MKSCTFEEIVDEIFNLFKERGIKRLSATKIANKLIMEQCIVPGKKLTSKTILQHPTRCLIYKYITKEKVAQYSEIKMKLGIRSESMYRFHLESLEKFGFIKSDIFGRGIRLLYHKDLDKQKAIYYYRLKDKIHFDIIMLLYNKGPFRLVDINYNLKVNAKYSLKNLIKIELVIKKDKFFSINTAKREEIKGIINNIKINKYKGDS